MTLSQEERSVMIRLEMERAHKITSEFPVYQTNHLWSTLANRMYYAVYHATMALLIANNLYAGTHQGVFVLLNQYFIKTGRIKPELGVLYARLQTMREKGDYNCCIETSEEDLLPLLPDVYDYIKTLENSVNQLSID